MTAPSRLRAADIRSQLATVLRDRPPRPIALHGTGERQEVVVGAHVWDVIPVRSELELRRALGGASDRPATALLVDYTDQLPLDIACRVAGSRVHSVDRALRLAHFFGARRAAPALVASTLGSVLLEELPEGIAPILGTVIQHEEAWARYLGLRLGWGSTIELSAAALLRAGLRDPGAGPALARRRDDAVWSAALAEIEQVIDVRSGTEALVVWRALLQGRLDDLLGWVLLVDAARRSNLPPALSALRVGLGYATGLDARLVDEPLAGSLAGLLDDALSTRDEAARQRIWGRARALQPGEGFDEALRHSAWLPGGRDALDAALAETLTNDLPSSQVLAQAVSLLEQLGRHHLVRDTDAGRRALAVREAGVRLLAWLVWQDHPDPQEVLGVNGLAQLVRWADEKGGWVDRARQEVRRHSTGHVALDAALRDSLLGRVDTLRRELDRAFAQALLTWEEAGRPAGKVMGIEHVLGSVAAAFLEGAPTRRLLVVVLDGMSTSVAARIGEAFEHWRPIAWTPPGREMQWAAVAALPTLTCTSRAALFAGRHEASAGDRAQAHDVARLAAHPKLAGYGPGGAGPRLFLKGELGSNGVLADTVVEALRSEDARVVGVVVNAVDDQLSGSDQLSVAYERPQAIPLLDALLRLAEETRRTILLTSDHGHVDASVLKRRPRPERSGGKSARWRTLGPGEAHLDGEIVLPDTCWGPRGEGPVAVPWDERICWAADSKGAHGGVSMAEAIVPVRLLAPPWFRDAAPGAPDDALGTGEVLAPRWWRLEVPRTHAPPTPGPTMSPGQLSLLPRASVPAPAPAPVGNGQTALTRALSASPLFKAYAREVGNPARVKRALEYIDLLARADGDALSTGRFARLAGIRPHRLAGQVALDTGFLNADGVTLIEVDPVADQVRLHTDRLRAQYGIEESPDV